MLIGEDDKRFVLRYFPELKFVEEDATPFLRGSLNFVATFNEKNEYTIYDSAAIPPDGNFIRDSYDIEINLDPLKNVYREVRETGGKIRNVAKGMNKPLTELHMYLDGSDKVCIWGYLDEKQDISLKEFLCEVVIPFFYDQSVFARDEIWPRDYYPHGCPGILENYAVRIKAKANYLDEFISVACIKNLKEVYDLHRDPSYVTIKKRATYRKDVKQNWKCICGHSDFKSCDSDVCLGLKILHKNIKEFHLKKLFV